MKKLFTLIALALVSVSLYAQEDITLCHTSTMDKFALMASNKDFNKAHKNPLPYKHISQAGGKMVSFKTPDGKEAQGYLIEAKQKTDNWIFVFQEWWGLNDHIKRQAEQLYNDLGNVNVIALDMYDGKVATERADASKYMQEFKQDRGDGIVKGALDYAGKNAKVGTIGWCFGGAQSLMASLTASKQAVACVMYYGMPVDNVEKLKTLNTDVLGIFGTQDKFINPGVVKKFEENMKAAGKKVTIKNYDADHGFANPSNPIYNKTAAEDAWKHTVAFFKERIK